MSINTTFNKLFSAYSYRKDESCAKFNPPLYSLPNILASFLFEITIIKVLGPIVTHCDFTVLKTCVKVLKTKHEKNQTTTPPEQSKHLIMCKLSNVEVFEQ